MNLKGKVIHTPTKEIFDTVMELAEKQGWSTMSNIWDSYKEETCVDFLEKWRKDQIEYCETKWYIKEGYNVLPFRPLNIKWL